jgi:hypothetical protein
LLLSFNLSILTTGRGKSATNMAIIPVSLQSGVLPLQAGFDPRCQVLQRWFAAMVAMVLRGRA